MKNIWTLSLAGNKATERQAVALAQALIRENGQPGVEMQSFFPAPPTHAIETLASNKGVTWDQPLSEAELNALGLHAPWPDMVVSCRPEVAAIALGIKAASRRTTRIIHIQNPNGAAGAYHFTLADFDLIVRQPHERIAGQNVISSELALHGLTPAILRQFRETALELSSTLKHPITAVMVGGSDEAVTLDDRQFAAFGDDLRRQAGRQPAGSLVILASRRTGKPALDILRHKLAGAANVVIEEGRPGYYDMLIAVADRFIVTAESLSMVSEAMATGKPCSLYDFHGALRAHPLDKVFSGLIAAGTLTRFPDMPQANPAPYDELPRLARTIQQRLNL